MPPSDFEWNIPAQFRVSCFVVVEESNLGWGRDITQDVVGTLTSLVRLVIWTSSSQNGMNLMFLRYSSQIKTFSWIALVNII